MERKKDSRKIWLHAIGILSSAIIVISFCARLFSPSFAENNAHSIVRLIEKTFSTAKINSLEGLEPEEENEFSRSETAGNTSSAPSLPFTESKKEYLFSWDDTSSAAEEAPKNTFPITELVVGGGVQYGNFFVKSDASLPEIDFLAELKQTPQLNVKKDGSPTVLLYHTHTSEAYLTEEQTYYEEDMSSRSTDATRSVIRVGDAIAAVLEEAGFGVIHDTTLHDEIYSGSYDRSAQTVAKYLEAYPDIEITIDIHRDGLETEDREKYKPTATINGEKAAQIMIISGCDPDGSLEFPHWESNLRFALQLQENLSDQYPQLMRPLYFCNRKYNMGMTKGSLLVEFGTDVNTAQEAEYAGSLFGQALVEELSALLE